MRLFRWKTTMSAAVALALVAAGGAAAVAVGVILPPQADDRAREATAGVILPEASRQDEAGRPAAPQGDPESAPSPDENAAFGQCVAAEAKTASDDHPEGWNPTDACEHLRNQPEGEPEGEGGPDHATGLDRAREKADDHATPGEPNGGAANASGGGNRAAKGGNGPAHADEHGADNASVRGGNADKP